MQEKPGAGARPTGEAEIVEALKQQRIIGRNLVGVIAALNEAGINPSTIIRPPQAGPGPPLRPHSNLPKGAQWHHHEKAGSRAAQRRLRQAAKGHHRLEDRCSLCGEWTSATLGGFKDPKSGKFACNGCASAYVQGLKG